MNEQQPCYYCGKPVTKYEGARVSHRDCIYEACEPIRERAAEQREKLEQGYYKEDKNE